MAWPAAAQEPTPPPLLEVPDEVPSDTGTPAELRLTEAAESALASVPDSRRDVVRVRLDALPGDPQPDGAVDVGEGVWEVEWNDLGVRVAYLVKADVIEVLEVVSLGELLDESLTATQPSPLPTLAEPSEGLAPDLRPPEGQLETFPRRAATPVTRTYGTAAPYGHSRPAFVRYWRRLATIDLISVLLIPIGPGLLLWQFGAPAVHAFREERWGAALGSLALRWFVPAAGALAGLGLWSAASGGGTTGMDGLVFILPGFLVGMVTACILDYVYLARRPLERIGWRAPPETQVLAKRRRG